MKNEIVCLPSYWASVSGGKDSLYMLKLILENPCKYPLDGVVHFELEIDYPFIKDVIKYMKDECEKHGIKFVTIKPRKSFYDLYEQRGFPSRTVRWCNNMYKLDAQKQLESFLKDRGFYLVNYIGLCADEAKRFKSDPNKRVDGQKVIYPLAENGIVESDILEWAKGVDIFNGYYKYNKRCGCMFCPMQSMMNTAYLMYFYPEEYKKMYYMVSKTESEITEKKGKPYATFSGNAKYNMQYRDRVVREKYLPKIVETEKNDKGMH